MRAFLQSLRCETKVTTQDLTKGRCEKKISVAVCRPMIPRCVQQRSKCRTSNRKYNGRYVLAAYKLTTVFRLFHVGLFREQETHSRHITHSETGGRNDTTGVSTPCTVTIHSTTPYRAKNTVTLYIKYSLSYW